MYKKTRHTLEILEKLNKNIALYNQLIKEEQLQIHISIIERLLSQPDNKLCM